MKVYKEAIIDKEKVEIIWKIVTSNYENLRKDFIRGGTVSKIDICGESPDDKFHNALIKIVERLSRFEYISDEKTLEYIRSRLFFEKKTDFTVTNRLKKKVNFIYDSETILNNIPDDDN